MKLSRSTPAKVIEVWQPRYHDMKVLIAKHKVGTHNEIKFTKAKSMPDVYYLSGEDIKQYPVETNGTIDCYAVPVSELEILERV